MTDNHEQDDKAAKKQAKAESKAAKKQAKAEADALAAQHAGTGDTTPDADSPAERSARAAERKVRLESWRTLFAAVGALVGLATLLYMTRQGCI